MTTARLIELPARVVDGALTSALAARALLMSTTDLFAGVARERCQEIASRAGERSFSRDELLFAQGQRAEHIILLLSGSVKLTQTGLTGNPAILGMKGSGDALSIQSEVPFHIHTSSARAVERCKVLTWRHSRLRDLIEEHPAIGENINRLLSKQISDLEERFRELATEHAARRLALLLVRLVTQIGTTHPAGMRICLSREELAQMTGTTLFTISRILSKWAETGSVVPRRQSIIIPNPLILAALASDD